MNLLTIKGRMASDPEKRIIESKTTLCNFTVAVNRRFQKDKTDFIDCTAFGKTGDFVGAYFLKGQEILCSGELHIDKYTKDGGIKTHVSLIVDNVEFCGKKDKTNNKTDEAQAQKSDNSEASEVSEAFETLEPDEDLPF